MSKDGTFTSTGYDGCGHVCVEYVYLDIAHILQAELQYFEKV